MKLNIKVREIMKGKLYETLIGTDARLAITISGEELKEFIEDVMADARLRAESEIKAKQSEECIDKEEVKTLLVSATQPSGNGPSVVNSSLRKSDQETSTASRMSWRY